MDNKKQTVAERFANLVEKHKQDGSLQIDEAKLELSEQIFQAMENKGISEVELSRRLNVSRSYINKILQGDTNFTIETLVKIGLALDCKFEFYFVNNNQETDIIDAEIIYIEEEPFNKPNLVSNSFGLGFKLNGYYEFEDFAIKKGNEILETELQFS